MCSIEALLTRIAKGKGLPEISPAVDLGNAVSLMTRPAHRRARHGHGRGARSRCAPPGRGQLRPPSAAARRRTPEPGEIVYVSSGEVRTRRWTWRQSETGKITPDTRDLLFPIDGFAGVNLERVLAAREMLAGRIESVFGARAAVGLVDREHPVFEAEP